jgi:hypothetical protein
MIVIVPSIIVSVVLVCSMYARAKGQHGVGGACWLAGGATALLAFVCSPALFLHAVGSFVLALFCAGLKLGPKAVLSTSLAAMAASYGLVLSMSLGELRELNRLRAEYPVESVAERLAYEEERVQPASAMPVLAGEVEQRLGHREERGSYSYRSHMLARLHDRAQDEFVLATGFGPVRMLRARRERIELPAAPPVMLPPLPEPYSPSTDQPPLPLAKQEAIEPLRPSASALLTLHDNGLEDFFNADRMGYAKDRNHVVGFQPHRFLSAPRLSEKEPAKVAWQVARLELVSLLKHETPVAYVSEYLPQMEQLKHAPTRALSGFERGAVERLRADEDLVIDEGPQRIRMVGSLRAGKNCLECHSVQRGELLGAFSYELVPEHSAPAQQHDAKLGPQA